MRFEIGSKVKWKETSTFRLGFALSDQGKVAGVKHVPGEEGETHLDVEFDNGDTVHDLPDFWIEPVDAPALAS
jgi:hypothetical protein